jgi:uncharacterized protein (TIGR02145 family)
MKRILFLICIFCALKATAQNFLISFAGSGPTTSVSAVKVENLTRGTSLNLISGDILSLVVATSVYPVKDNQSSEIRIYPNPMTDYSIVQVFPPEAGKAFITVLDMTGKLVAQSQSYLGAYRHDFRLSGIKNGFYFVNVKGNNYQFTGKLQSIGKSNGTISIEKINYISQEVDEKTAKNGSKGALATVDMPYTIGDRLKFTGATGIYSTVKMDIPSSSKTIIFNFYACTDGDNNNYPVVEIGTQVWMAENLKTTKYKNGTPVPLVADVAAWAILNDPGYCWYNNDEATNKNIYGALYHWSTGNTGNLCPTGWHIPSDTEWHQLVLFLDPAAQLPANGIESAIAGGKLKGTTHWLAPNSGVTNESGFTALPGGYRHIDGTFNQIGNYGEWDSSTETGSSNRFARIMTNISTDVTSVTRGPIGKRRGLSVRCVKD